MSKGQKKDFTEFMNDLGNIDVNNKEYDVNKMFADADKDTKPKKKESTAPQRKDVCITIGIYLEKSLYKDLKLKALTEDIAVNRLIERLIRQYLDSSK